MVGTITAIFILALAIIGYANLYVHNLFLFCLLVAILLVIIDIFFSVFWIVFRLKTYKKMVPHEQVDCIMTLFINVISLFFAIFGIVFVTIYQL